MKLILRKIGFFTAFIIPALVIIGFYIGGYGNFLTVIFSFLFIPLIDQLLGIDTSNVPKAEVSQKEDEFFYRFVTYCWTFIQFAFLLWGCYAVISGRLT